MTDPSELAAELIQEETVSPIEDPAAFTPITHLLDAADVQYTLHEFDGVCSLTAATGTRGEGVCLNGHLDVVPAGTGWSITDPFDPVVRDGKLYGRGASDMKGGLASQVLAFLDLHDDPSFSGSVTLMIGGDEERGGFKSTKPLLESDDAYRYCIIGEPTDLDLQVGYRGKLHVDIFLEGENVHAARPQTGRNVITDLPQVIDALDGLSFAEDNTALPPPTAALTMVETDPPQNSIPGEARIGMDIRYTQAQTPDGIVAEIKEAVAAADVAAHVEPRYFGPPCYLEDKTLLDAGRTVITQIRGEAPAEVTAGGSSDGVHFEEHGIPFLEVGPEHRNVHGADEYCRESTLEELRTIYQGMVKQLVEG
ncbi:MAG: M20/M25/M40 family metallo-hydrolase [Candidatus Nanohaloarchaea archaeon]|nr:M20/M25/M40 family metallo-hydrolase [Candidatus Nanohaloarchaea archaeon]